MQSNLAPRDQPVLFVIKKTCTYLPPFQMFLKHSNEDGQRELSGGLFYVCIYSMYLLPFAPQVRNSLKILPIMAASLSVCFYDKFLQGFGAGVGQLA